MALGDLINLLRYSSSCTGLAFFEVFVCVCVCVFVELETIVLCKTHHTQMRNTMCPHSFVKKKEIDVIEVDRQTVVTKVWGE